VTVLQAEAPPALRPKVELAVKFCPTHALTLEDP
jgi:ferredoxin